MTKLQRCVYCKTAIATTRDHIPPATLFAKPRPSDLFTVPCCEPCNNGASQDDEYFRLILVAHAEIGDHPAAQPLLASVTRSLERQQVSGLARNFIANVSERDVVTPSGIFVRRAFGYDADLSRLDRVGQRICEGLYFKKYNDFVPSEFEITTWSYDGLGDVDEDQRARLEAMITWIKVDNPPLSIGNGAFKYFYREIEGRKGAGAWVLSFFDREMFLCFTSPAEST